MPKLLFRDGRWWVQREANTSRRNPDFVAAINWTGKQNRRLEQKCRNAAFKRMVESTASAILPKRDVLEPYQRY